jgi:NADH dehydrogenase FAD-containing subunit
MAGRLCRLIRTIRSGKDGAMHGKESCGAGRRIRRRSDRQKAGKKLKKRDVEINIIDRNPFHTMLTELHEVAAARVDEKSVRIELFKVFAGRDVKVVTDSIKTADYEKGQLVGECGIYRFDYLVLASGSKPTFFGVAGSPGAQLYALVV